MCRKSAGAFGHRGVSPTRYRLAERTTSLRRKTFTRIFLRRNYLLRSRAGVRDATGAPSDQDATTTMEKLDAALNNMSHGLCIFAPDNRLLLWNDRYIKMYRLAPDRLRVGCTLDEMLEARKARARTAPAFVEREIVCAGATGSAARSASVHRLFGL